MKKIKLLLFAVITIAINVHGQNVPCGSVVYDSFDTDGAIPAEWTEYNTSDQVTVDGGLLKFDFTADLPSAYRTFDAVSKNFSYSFKVKSTRNWVKAKMHLVSSTGKYLTSLIFGNDGAKNIQYATALDASNAPGTYSGALLDGNYASNTSYFVSLSVDFEAKTINFYQDGILKAADIPFLEQVTDVAKIDINQISMYSSEGRFFFDDIVLAAEDVDRVDLSAAVSAGQLALNSAVVGKTYGQYPQSTYNTLSEKITEATPVLEDCAATQTEIDQTLESLEAAFLAFNESKVDEPVLKLFSDYDFSGEEQDYKCGYYNGTLGEFEDKPISFKLDSGYMVTFAQDVNGLGISKVYISQGKDLAINLPEELQRSISFMRVGPWFNADKKGSCGKGLEVMDTLGVNWYYNWGSSGDYSPHREFVPMTWSGVPSLAKMAELGSNMAMRHHLAFNEPDGPDQANMTVEKALEGYEKMLASGLRLGAPAVTHENRGTLWLDEFMDSCRARNYRVDFIPAHHYIRRTTSGLYAYLKKIYDKHQVPMWLTEYNYGNANYSKIISDEIALAKLKGFDAMLDTCSFMERYSAFYFQPSKGQLSFFVTRTPIELNSIGIYYRDHESGISYTQEEYEQGAQINTGIESAENSAASILVYPNPVTGNRIYIKYLDDFEQGITQISLFDINGQEVFSADKILEFIDVSTFEKGCYVISIHSNDQVVNEVVMIQ